MHYFTFIELLFISGEFLLLPAYISATLNEKHDWILPISLCVIPPSISFFIFDNPSILPQALSGIYITYYCFKYFKFLFVTKKVFSLAKAPHFWIVLGIMICYTGSIPSSVSMLVLEVVGTSQLEHGFANFLVNLFLILNIIMHSFFNKAFTCSQEQQSFYSFQ
jgi:hypothetical protein